MKVNHPTYCEWPWPIFSRSSHAFGKLCRSQSRATNNMYIKLIFIAQEHLTPWVRSLLKMGDLENIFLSLGQRVLSSRMRSSVCPSIILDHGQRYIPQPQFTCQIIDTDLWAFNFFYNSIIFWGGGNSFFWQKWKQQLCCEDFFEKQVK